MHTFDYSYNSGRTIFCICSTSGWCPWCLPYPIHHMSMLQMPSLMEIQVINLPDCHWSSLCLPKTLQGSWSPITMTAMKAMKAMIATQRNWMRWMVWTIWGKYFLWRHWKQWEKTMEMRMMEVLSSQHWKLLYGRLWSVCISPPSDLHIHHLSAAWAYLWPLGRHWRSHHASTGHSINIEITTQHRGSAYHLLRQTSNNTPHKPSSFARQYLHEWGLATAHLSLPTGLYRSMHNILYLHNGLCTAEGQQCHSIAGCLSPGILEETCMDYTCSCWAPIPTLDPLHHQYKHHHYPTIRHWQKPVDGQY